MPSSLQQADSVRQQLNSFANRFHYKSPGERTVYSVAEGLLYGAYGDPNLATVFKWPEDNYGLYARETKAYKVAEDLFQAIKAISHTFPAARRIAEVKFQAQHQFHRPEEFVLIGMRFIADLQSTEIDRVVPGAAAELDLARKLETPAGNIVLLSEDEIIAILRTAKTSIAEEIIVRGIRYNTDLPDLDKDSPIYKALVRGLIAFDYIPTLITNMAMELQVSESDPLLTSIANSLTKIENMLRLDKPKNSLMRFIDEVSIDCVQQERRDNPLRSWLQDFFKGTDVIDHRLRNIALLGNAAAELGQAINSPDGQGLLNPTYNTERLR